MLKLRGTKSSARPIRHRWVTRGALTVGGSGSGFPETPRPTFIRVFNFPTPIRMLRRMPSRCFWTRSGRQCCSHTLHWNSRLITGVKSDKVAAMVSYEPGAYVFPARELPPPMPA
jgi:hypothetical protein